MESKESQNTNASPLEDELINGRSTSGVLAGSLFFIDQKQRKSEKGKD